VTIYENKPQGESEPNDERTWQSKPFHTPRPTLQEPGATLLYERPETEAASKVSDEQPNISFNTGGAKSVVGLLDRADSDISEGFRAVGQIFNTFIIIEDGNNVLLLDQHTAHERVNYERLVDKHNQGRVESQELLFPVNLELSKTDYERVLTSLDYFNNLGFSLEDFGGQTVAIRAVPALLGSGDHGSLILDILDNAGEIEGKPDFSRLAESAINIMACRSSVMAGQKLDQREISALVDDLKKCRLPYTCPHGRPVAMTITENELLKEFMRK
jgi:DNA mismatch repair protein MutL